MTDKKITIKIEGDASSLNESTQQSQGYIKRIVAGVIELISALKTTSNQVILFATTAVGAFSQAATAAYALTGSVISLGAHLLRLASLYLGLTVHLESHNVKLNTAAKLIEKFHFEIKISLGFLSRFADALQAIHFPIQSLIDFINQMSKANIVLGIGRGKKIDLFDGLKADLDKVKQAFHAVEAVGKKTAESIRESFTKFGAAMAAESIIEWRGVKFEASFADVKKVVNGSIDSIKNLRKELLDMSTEIAMPIDGLAKMEAIAGQLGFPVDQIDDFVRLVSKGAVAFELLPEKAAESFGNLKNIYDLSLQELEFFGDQINYIADKANTNESSLLDVMNRAGGTAQRFGLLRGETIALSAAMLSMGKPPEVVGTALDGLLGSLQNAENQSKDFQEGLKLLGMDAKTLADNIQKNPKKTLDDFLLTLSKLSAKSQTDILSRLVGDAGEAKGVIGDLIGKLGEYQRLTELSKADDIGGSMDATFKERQQTVESAITMMKNAWDGLAVSASTLFLPTVRAVAEGLRDLAVWLRRVNDEYPNLAAFARIALIFGTLGTVIQVFFKNLPAIISRYIGSIGSAFSSSVVTAVKSGLAALPGLATTLMSTFFGRLIAGAALLTFGFNGVLAAISALSSAFVFLVSNPVALFLTGLGVISVRLIAAKGAFAMLGAASAGLGRTLMTLVGGPIGLTITALAFLIIKYNEIKNVTFKFGEANVTLSEILSATWRLISAMFSDVGGFIGSMFNNLGGYLRQFVGVNDSAWLEIKNALSAALQNTKTFINAVIGGFVGLGAAVGVSLGVFVEHIKTEFKQAVDLAKAAAKDIKAAFSGDFSGSHYDAQLNSNEQQDKSQSAGSGKAISEALQSGFGKDYVGDFGGRVADDFNDGLNAAKKGVIDYGKQWQAVINAEIIAQRSRPKDKDTEKSKPKVGGIDLPDLPDDSKKGGKSGKSKGSQMPQESEMHGFEFGLEQQKIAFQKKNALLDFSKQAEKAYWDDIIANYKGNDKTLAELKKKSADLELQILRDNAQKSQELLKEKQQAEYDLANDQLAAKQDEAQQQYNLGVISQAELLNLERQYAQESYQIALKLAKQKRDLTLQDTVARAQAENDILQVIRDGAKKDKDLANQQAVDKKNQFKEQFAPLENALDQSVNGILTGQQTIKNATKNAAQSIVVSYAAAFIKKRTMAVAEWAWEALGFAGVEAKKKAIKNAGFIWDGILWAKKKVMLAAGWAWETLGFGAKEATNATTKIVSEGVQTGAQVTGDVIRTGSTIASAEIKDAVTEKSAKKSIFTYALEAAAASYNSAAAIPYVGWILGPIAAAAAFVGVMAFGSQVGSAKGGEWQVGEDGSPYILHENESVLPAGVADNFRKVVEIVKGSTGFNKTNNLLPPNTAELIDQLMSSGAIAKRLSLPQPVINLAASSADAATGFARDQYRVKRDEQKAAYEQRKKTDELRIHTVTIDDFFTKHGGVMVKVAGKEARKFNGGKK